MLKKIGTALVLACLLPGAALAEDQITIHKTVVDTLRYAPRLEMIKHNREAVEHDLKKSRGLWYPRIDVRGGIGTDAHSSRLTRAEDRDNDWDRRTEASAVLTQRLYDGGDGFGQVRLDKTRLASLDHRVLDNAESLALDAIIANLEVYRQRELLALAEENAQAHKSILSSLQEREKGGAGSAADVKQTQARLAMAQASLSKAHASLQAALSDYQRLTGVFPGQIALEPYPGEVLPNTLEEMTAQAASGNPKLGAAAEDINSESERVGIAKSNYHPYVYAELSSAYQDGVEDQDRWEMTNAAMLRLNWNLFNGGSDMAAVKAARARMRQAQSDREDLVLAVTDETRATWALYHSALNEVQEYTSAVEFNRSTRGIYLEQFGVAQRSLLDVLDSENEVFQSASQLVTARVNEHIAAYKLMALSGKLISSLRIDPDLYQKGPEVRD